MHVVIVIIYYEIFKVHNNIIILQFDINVMKLKNIPHVDKRKAHVKKNQCVASDSADSDREQEHFPFQNIFLRYVHVLLKYKVT